MYIDVQILSAQQRDLDCVKGPCARFSLIQSRAKYAMLVVCPTCPAFTPKLIWQLEPLHSAASCVARAIFVRQGQARDAVNEPILTLFAKPIMVLIIHIMCASLPNGTRNVITTLQAVECRKPESPKDNVALAGEDMARSATLTALLNPSTRDPSLLAVDHHPCAMCAPAHKTLLASEDRMRQPDSLHPVLRPHIRRPQPQVLAGLDKHCIPLASRQHGHSSRGVDCGGASRRGNCSRRGKY